MLEMIPLRMCNIFWDLKFFWMIHTFCGSLLCGKKCPEYFVSFVNNFWDLIFFDDPTLCGGLLCGKECLECLVSVVVFSWKFAM